MRLTEKHRDLENIYSFEGLENIEEGACKLGQLEDIEQELGIDIPTFFEIMSADEIVVKHSKELLYIPSCDIRWEGVLRGRIAVILEEKQHEDGGMTITYGNYYFKDYGKTWALTKEELE